MDFVFKKVTHFTRLVKAGGRLREFNFRKLNDRMEDGWFHIDVADDRGDRLVLRLHERGALETGLFAQMPAWLEEALPQLRHIIGDPANYKHEV
jgi:hypothetical protein